MGKKQTTTSSPNPQNLNVQIGPVEVKDIGQKIGKIIDDFTKDITLKW